jgi:hypothetical protein
VRVAAAARCRGTLKGVPSRAPSYPQIARAQWLLGLDAPESAEEIKRAWKERVARTHPDRHAARAGAATRVTAAFNQARELCEWWLEAGEAWPKPMAPEALREAEPERAVRQPARTPEQNRSSFRAGDLVTRAVPGRDPAAEPVQTVHASGAGADERIELEDGTTAAPGELVPVAYGCPVCGQCSGPAVERPALRPCPPCLAELVQLERSERAVEPALRAIRTRARAGRATAAELGDHGLEELARERYRWAEGVGRRPREERRGRMLAAYAHAYALWAAGTSARDPAGV